MNDDTISRKSVIDAVHAAVRPFIADDGDEMNDADTMTLSINKAICNAVKALPTALPKDHAHVCWGCNCEKVNALQTEKTQLSKEDATKDATFDCISRQAAVDAILAIKDYGNSDRANALGLAEFAVTTLPPVHSDIIQCKDCENWLTDWALNDAPGIHFCAVVDGFHDGDWYCADAKRDSGGADMRGKANDD